MDSLISHSLGSVRYVSELALAKETVNRLISRNPAACYRPWISLQLFLMDEVRCEHSASPPSFLPSFRYLPRIPFKDLYPSLFTLNMHLNGTKESGRKNHLKRESEVTANITITRMQFIQIQFLADLKQVQQTCKTRLLWELILTFHAASSPAPAYLYSSGATSIPAKSLTRRLSWAGIYYM